LEVNARSAVRASAPGAKEKGNAMSDVPRGQPLKERQRQEREWLILQAAEELLIERGYHETSIDDIAARVGISKGTVYLHFASKEDLVVALVEHGRRQFLAALDGILSTPGTPREKLYAILRLVYGNMSDQHVHHLRMILQRPELMSRLVEARQAFTAAWEEPMRRVAAVLDEGKAMGEFDREISTPVMVSMLGSLLTPHGYHRLVVEQHMPLDEVVAALTRFFFKGIAAPTVAGSEPISELTYERDASLRDAHREDSIGEQPL
jgi:AcrR family transcriptional regulator